MPSCLFDIAWLISLRRDNLFESFSEKRSSFSSCKELSCMMYRMAQLSVRLCLLLSLILSVSSVPSQPGPGQRCAGRNYNGRRCCTPEQPCPEGEGDCDGPGDGGQHDGHRGCAGDLECGSNNCLQFGLYYHPKDDCCERPAVVSTPPPRPHPQPGPGVLMEPPPGRS